MKLPTVLLVGSLVANVVLAAAFLTRSFSSEEKISATSAVPAAPGSSQNAKTNSAGQLTTAPEKNLSGGRVTSAWDQLQGGDLHTLAARLREAGFPPSVVKAIVSAQVFEQFSARRKALMAQQEEVPFWKTQQRSVMDPKTMSELRALSREQTNLMKELLGPDGFLGADEMQAYQKRQYGDLARDKLEQMQNIAADYNELRQQIYQTANGVILPEDREKLSLLEKEQRADMSAILTPEELENYDLRSSTTASMLRSQLSTFKPTEEEFRALFRATRAAEEQYGALSAAGPNPNQMRDIQAAVLAEMTNSMPPDRLAELKQAADPAYQQINRLVARLELPSSAATQVVAVQQEIQKQAAALRSDRQLSNEQRNAQLAELAQEATQKLTPVLGGTRGIEAYKQYGGQWLQALVPRTAPNPMTAVPSAVSTPKK
jgi:hypothetical protein